MHTQNTILSELLQCGYWDAEYIAELYDQFGSSELIENLVADWKLGYPLNANAVISQLKDRQAKVFISENEGMIREITGVEELYDVEYEVYANCLDSHVWFEDERVQNLFVDWNEERLKQKRKDVLVARYSM